MPKATTTAKRGPRIKEPVLPEPDAEQEGDIIVSYSELDTYRQCPLKHLIAYKNRWTKPPKEDSPLTKGSLWHEVMEIHYNIIKEYQDANDGRSPSTEQENRILLALIRVAISPLLHGDKGEQSENQALIEWMYDGYVERWGTDPQWRILGVEYKLQRRLMDPDGDPSPFLMKAKLDLIVLDRETMKVWIIDHKSGQNLPSQMELDIDDQFGGYTWLLRNAGLNVIGAIHNAARTTQNAGDKKENQDAEGNPLKASTKKQTLEQRMSRTRLNRSDAEVANIALDAWAVAENAYPDEGFERPLYSSPDPRQCGWKCDFTEVHLATRAGKPLTKALEEWGFVQDFTRH